MQDAAQTFAADSHYDLVGHFELDDGGATFKHVRRLNSDFISSPLARERLVQSGPGRCYLENSMSGRKPSRLQNVRWHMSGTKRFHSTKIYVTWHVISVFCIFVGERIVWLWREGHHSTQTDHDKISCLILELSEVQTPPVTYRERNKIYNFGTRECNKQCRPLAVFLQN